MTQFVYDFDQRQTAAQQYQIAGFEEGSKVGELSNDRVQVSQNQRDRRPHQQQCRQQKQRGKAERCPGLEPVQQAMWIDTAKADRQWIHPACPP